MEIRTRMCMSADGYVTTPDGRPVQLADPAFVPGQSYDFPAFQQRCEAVLMGRVTFEPALGAEHWPWPGLDVFVLGSHRPDGTPREVVVGSDPSSSSLSGRRTAVAMSTWSADPRRSRRSAVFARSTSSD
jgi:dihydrofolate reductase